MEQESFIDFYSYEYKDLNAEDAIFQAYLYAFFRHKAYIGKLYNTGKISKAQATERIDLACKKLKLIKKPLEHQPNPHNYDKRTQFYLVNATDLCLELGNKLGLWN